MMHLGSYDVGASVHFKFATNLATGARANPSDAWEAADIRVYKDGSDTQRSSTAGFTVTSTFDSMTGITHVTIDLSDNTDAGFYAAGHEYDIVLYPDETVDGVAVSAVVAHFAIERLEKVNVTEINGGAATGVGTPETTLAAGAINAAAFDTDTDVYQAKVTIQRNTGTPADLYVVAWFKNGAPVVSGITGPKLQIVKVADGTDLVADTAMTQIGSLGLSRYTEATNRITAGVAYYAHASATIGGSSRVWNQPIGRDA